MRVLTLLALSLWFAQLMAADDAALRAKAEELAKKFIIVDTHVDLPYRLENNPEEVNVRTARGEMDYVRAKAGGLDAPFMSIYTPASLQKPGEAKAHANRLIDMVEGIAAKWPDKFAIATSPEEVRQQFAKGLVSLPLGLENGSPIGDDLANLKVFYDRGIRYITLTHSRNNLICDSSYDSVRKWNGLSPFGREVVKEMNRLGIMVDISHVSDDAFYQVMEIAKAPAIASHSSCRAFTPGFERNMDDAMIKTLAKNGGVIMINFGSSFISDTYRKGGDEIRTKVRSFMEEHQLPRNDPKVRALIDRLRKELKFADVTDVVDHIDHVVKLVGVDYVGFGSDYDGVGDSLPTGLKDVSQYPNLIYHLLKAGYSEGDIEKMCYGNIFRVWDAVNDYAAVQP